MTKYSLEDIKILVREALSGDQTKVWFSGKSRSVHYIIYVFQCIESKAEDIILQGLLRLQSDDFARSVIMQSAPDLVVADEYGLKNYKGHNWYIKFLIESDNGEKLLTSISFHPVERPLQLVDGRTLHVTLDLNKRPKKK